MRAHVLAHISRLQVEVNLLAVIYCSALSFSLCWIKYTGKALYSSGSRVRIVAIDYLKGDAVHKVFFNLVVMASLGVWYDPVEAELFIASKLGL